MPCSNYRRYGVAKNNRDWTTQGSNTLCWRVRVENKKRLMGVCNGQWPCWLIYYYLIHKTQDTLIWLFHMWYREGYSSWPRIWYNVSHCMVRIVSSANTDNGHDQSSPAGSIPWWKRSIPSCTNGRIAHEVMTRGNQEVLGSHGKLKWIEGVKVPTHDEITLVNS